MANDFTTRQVPTPSYEYDVDELVHEYKTAMLEIKSELDRQDVSSLSKANARGLLDNISERLKEIDLFAEEWIRRNMPRSVAEGVASTLVNLEVVGSLDAARKIVQFNSLNKNLVEAAIADTQDDILEVTNNVSKKVRREIRRATSEVTRENMSRGINGNKTMQRDLNRKIRKRLGSAVDTGIVDRSRRRWKPEDYVEMLTRTKMADNYREAQTNEALERSAQYGVISYAGSKDACRFHEGRIIKLDPEASGSYPTYEELRDSNQIFHPNCVHHFTVLRDPEKLPSDILNKAVKQQKRGDAALATGKRNPKMD